MNRQLILLLCLFLPWLGRAGEPDSTADLARVEGLAWMTGNWRADTDQGLAQEVWTGPRAGSMSGMFRLITGDRVTVLEYIVIAEEAEGVFYQFKHFRPDYTTWEGENPPIRMKLVEAQAGLAVFENTVRVQGQPAFITYRLEDDGRLSVFVGDEVNDSRQYQGLKFVLSKENPMATDRRINYLELPARDLDAGCARGLAKSDTAIAPVSVGQPTS